MNFKPISRSRRQNGHSAIVSGIGCVLLSVAGTASSPLHAAEGFVSSLSKDGAGFIYSVDSTPGFYYELKGTTNLAEPFLSFGMGLGGPGPIFRYAPEAGESSFFIISEGISVFAPRDTDGDQMDDLYEIGARLDPLDPTDASKASPNVAGFTNLQEYQDRFGIDAVPAHFISREVSVANLGPFSLEAISREISLFILPPPDLSGAISREVTIFNGDRPPLAGYSLTHSREVSVWTLPGTPGAEAMSREISVFNGDRLPGSSLGQVHSRELSVFMFQSSPIEGISREISIDNQSVSF